ncbi:hypothetical protein [Algiphilus sp.]|uniref:hypothetical protein n=1 Tax=Algiphilus sp. TaxID=1872431 RepID=UPI003B51A8D7
MRSIFARWCSFGILPLVLLAGTPSKVGAVTVSTNGSGSAVVVPYYSVNGGWETLINLTNTTTNSLAVKVRLHEAQNGRSVMNFNVALSPLDVWTAYIQADADGRPVLRTNDTSCTSPLNIRSEGLRASEQGYSTIFDFLGLVSLSFRDHDATDGSIERMREGYITVLVMGETAGQGTAPDPANDVRGSTAWFAKHENGIPRNCLRVAEDFEPEEAGNFLEVLLESILSETPLAIRGDQGSGNPIARATATNPSGYGPIVSPTPLKVNATLVNQDRGTAAGVDSFPIAGYGEGRNLVTAQGFPFNLEPTLASSNDLWSTTGLAQIEAGIAANSVANEWSNNPNTGAGSEWVVTMPTKRFHVDEDALNLHAACNVYRNSRSSGGTVVGVPGLPYLGFNPLTLLPPELLLLSTCPLEPFNQRFQSGNNGASPTEFTIAVYDREENTAALDTGPIFDLAPDLPPLLVLSPPAARALVHSANVLRIGRGSDLPNVLNSNAARTIDVDSAGLAGDQAAGWARIRFTAETGHPATGFIFKERNFRDATKNMGQALAHAYQRPSVLNLQDCRVPVSNLCLIGGDNHSGGIVDILLRPTGPLGPLAGEINAEDLVEAIATLLENDDGSLNAILTGLITDGQLQEALELLLLGDGQGNGDLQDIIGSLLLGDGSGGGLAGILGPDGVAGLVEALLTDGTADACQANLGTLCLIGGDSDHIGLVDLLLLDGGVLEALSDELTQEELVEILGDTLESNGALAELVANLIQGGQLEEGLTALLVGDGSDQGGLVQAVQNTVDNLDTIIEDILSFIGRLTG